LQLLGDRFCNERGVELRLADLDDVDHDVGRREIGDLLAQLLDVGALLADDDARPRRMDRHPTLLVRALDDDLGDRRLLQGLLRSFAAPVVLVQQLALLILARVPARVPRPVDAETQSDRIDLLTHRSAPYAPAAAATSRTTIVRCENGLKMRPTRPRPR